MATLHLVNHAGVLDACLQRAHVSDAVLLIEDGVYAATRPLSRPVFVLKLDVQARGLMSRLCDEASLVDDAGFVDLVAGHQPIVTWR
jgi:tRNA 2-thiouridine synthesizing protein B